MLGLFPGGNKTRKLEFLVADALAQGADTLITCGAVQSNHCRLTLAAAAKEGLKCRLLLEERVAGSYHPQGNGNHFMFELMGAESIEVLPGGADMAAAMQRCASALAGEGRKGYVIPGGGSNALGGLGYVACAQEILAQSFDSGVHFDAIVVGSGSSGTHGGLVAGLFGANAALPVIGIGVSRDPEQQEPLVHAEAVQSSVQSPPKRLTCRAAKGLAHRTRSARRAATARAIWLSLQAQCAHPASSPARPSNASRSE